MLTGQTTGTRSAPPRKGAPMPGNSVKGTEICRRSFEVRSFLDSSCEPFSARRVHDVAISCARRAAQSLEQAAKRQISYPQSRFIALIELGARVQVHIFGRGQSRLGHEGNTSLIVSGGYWRLTYSPFNPYRGLLSRRIHNVSRRGHFLGSSGSMAGFK